MTSRPSKMQTGFCSPSRMRSFGATPFVRRSFSWSVMYCSGFCLVASVAVSDMALLLVVGIGRGESLLCVSSRRGANHSRTKEFASARQAIRIQQNFPCQPSLQQRECIFELIQRRALAEERVQIQAAGFQKRSHLHPGFVHAAAVNALHCGALEN